LDYRPVNAISEKSGFLPPFLPEPEAVCPDSREKGI